MPDVIVIVCARDEATRLPATLHALRAALPAARIVVADDGSVDGTADVARDCGAEVVRSPRHLGKGGAATLAAEHVLAEAWKPAPPHVLLADADLGESAHQLERLLEPLERGEADLVVAAFARRLGGGVGAALGFARWAIERRCGLRLGAPISGQRAMRGEVLRVVVPFAHGFGMEIGMTVDAARAGFRVHELELDLEHRATGRTLAGFRHRGRQLRDFARVYLDRR